MERGYIVRIFHYVPSLARLWTNGTRLWSVWWRTSERLWSIPRSSWTYWWSARTRSRHVSRSAWTPKCLAVSLLLSSTLPKSWVALACCPWATCLFHSQTCGKLGCQLFVDLISGQWIYFNKLGFYSSPSPPGGPSRQTLVSPTSGLEWAMKKISSFLTFIDTFSHGRASSSTPREFGPSTPWRDKRPLLRTGI